MWFFSLIFSVCALWDCPMSNWASKCTTGIDVNRMHTGIWKNWTHVRPNCIRNPLPLLCHANKGMTDWLLMCIGFYMHMLCSNVTAMCKWLMQQVCLVCGVGRYECFHPAHMEKVSSDLALCNSVLPIKLNSVCVCFLQYETPKLPKLPIPLERMVQSKRFKTVIKFLCCIRLI